MKTLLRVIVMIGLLVEGEVRMVGQQDCKPDTKCSIGAYGSVTGQPELTVHIPIDSQTITLPPDKMHPGDCFKLSPSMTLERIKCPITKQHPARMMSGIGSDGSGGVVSRLDGPSHDGMCLEWISCKPNPTEMPSDIILPLNESAPKGHKIEGNSGSSSIGQLSGDVTGPIMYREPIDVPAIPRSPAMNCFEFVGEKIVSAPCAGWTCADKSRVLETAEDGKHWCRKIQN